jgi:excisionase family DNA binding protein
MNNSLGTMEMKLSEGSIEAIVKGLMEKLEPVISKEKEKDELLTIEEAAVLIKRSKGTIYQFVNNAKHGLTKFPYQKQGRQLRFSKLALLKWNSDNGP